MNNVDYVLVSNVCGGTVLVYYRGYYEKQQTFTGDKEFILPSNTHEYCKAMKIPYEKEAQAICDEINKQTKEGITSSFTYHVEEHMYMDLKK